MEEVKWTFIREMETNQSKNFTEKLKWKTFEDWNKMTSWEWDFWDGDFVGR